MTHPFQTAIAEALGPDLRPGPAVDVWGEGHLPSVFDVDGLALAAWMAAASELAAIAGSEARLSRRHALMWFDMTLRPEGWDLPSLWDAVAGDYEARNGWIRLHTNAPHHRAAALEVLGCAPDRAAVAAAVAGWERTQLEAAIVANQGCAAAMHSLSDWASHPQGQAVASEPLIAWSEHGAAPAEVSLQNLRILDLTRVLAGPVATRFLAGFGAQVLRIDPPDWSEPAVEQEVTLGKRCAGLDLRKDGDCAQFRSLLGQADVLVHGYRPGALAGLGFGPEALREIAPGLIDVSLCAYGWTGPWADRRGFDSLVQMSCGIAAEGMARAGAARPVPLPVQALDHATGYLMAAAVLRALRLRRETGRALSARLSLARTAALLVSGGVQEMAAERMRDGPKDRAREIEVTGWGPARRIRFPLTLNGQGPVWPRPAGPLRRDAPHWV